MQIPRFARDDLREPFFARALLSGLFAAPAGWGDIAIGATAPLVAWRLAKPAHRRAFLLWQALGMADLVMAVSLGAIAGMTGAGANPMVTMTVLPLSLVPAFLVPLFVILHIICITQARRWPAGSAPRATEAVVSPAG